MVLPERNSRGEYFGWYSWLPSVVWNPGLQKYVMVNGGTYGENLSNSSSDYYAQFMHNKTGSLGFWHSDNPYGPWTQFYYNDYWTADDSKNLTYQPKLFALSCFAAPLSNLATLPLVGGNGRGN